MNQIQHSYNEIFGFPRSVTPKRNRRLTKKGKVLRHKTYTLKKNLYGAKVLDNFDSRASSVWLSGTTKPKDPLPRRKSECGRMSSSHILPSRIPPSRIPPTYILGVFSKHCIHCRNMKPSWKKLQMHFRKDTRVTIKTFFIETVTEQDCHKMFRDYHIHLKAMNGYPTIMKVKKSYHKNRIIKTEYHGDRTFQDLLHWSLN